MIDLAAWAAAVPEALKKERAWVAWGPDPKSQRPKCPLVMSARERRASTRKPETWFDWKFASAWYGRYADGVSVGVGFVFTESMGLLYVDVDDAVNPEGELRDWAKPFVQPFLGRAYIELSPSGKGLHVIGRGQLPGGTCGGKANFPKEATGEKVPEVAMFASGKYTTLTGRIWKGNRNIADCTEAAADVWAAAGINATAVDNAVGAAPSEKELPDVEPKRVPKAVREELKNCTAEKAEDHSAARYKLYTAAARGGLTPEETFALVVQGDWYTSSGAAEKGREQTWADVARCAAKADTAAKEFQAEVEAASTAWEDLGIAITKTPTKDGGYDKRAVWGAFNIATVLSKHPEWKDRLKMNEFAERMELDGRPFADEDLVDMAEFVRGFLKWEQEPQLGMVFNAAMRAARDHAFNPLQDYLNGLEWDQESRMDEWLARAGCEDVPLNAKLGRKWLISLVARALRPGCKVDTVLILEGKQGQKKSSILYTLAGGADYFTDAHVNYDKDGLMVMHGSWIVEIAELSTFQKAEQERTKQFISGRDLTFRPPYGRTTRKFPRHFVITGSTNDMGEYLNDPTGARRYWPVRVVEKKLDLAWVAENRDQLLAEAVAAFTAGEEWWFEEEPEELVEAHAERTAEDPLTGKVNEYLDMNPGVEFTMSALLEFAGLPIESTSIAKRVGVVLHNLGYVRQRRMVNGRRTYFWRDPLFCTEEEVRLAS